MSKATAIFVPPPEAPFTPGTTVRIRSRQTGDAFCVCEATTLPGDGVSLHVHERDDEFYYILEGALEMEAGGDHFTAAAGALVVIPRTVPHKFRNSGTVPARALMIFRPGGFDDMLEQLREAERGSLGEEERRQILRRWGITGLEEGPIG